MAKGQPRLPNGRFAAKAEEAKATVVAGAQEIQGKTGIPWRWVVGIGMVLAVGAAYLVFW